MSDVGAFRALRKSPGFTVLAVLTLGLGIGATTFVFSIVYAALFRPLPYPNASRLVAIERLGPQGWDLGIPHRDFVEWQGRPSELENVASYRTGSLAFAHGDAPERATASRVSRAFMPLLGGRAQVGRVLVDGDHRVGAEKVVLLSHDLWQRRFGGDPSVVGDRVMLDGQPHTVVGVMPPSFRYPFRADLWTALETIGNGPAEASEPVGVVALLKQGATPEQAVRTLHDLSQPPSLAVREEPEPVLSVTPLRDTLPGSGKRTTRLTLLALQLAVSFVLLIGCANVAHLVLARNEDRSHEMAVRIALGCSRSRLVRQLLAESLLLGAIGGLAGVFLAQLGLDVLRASIPQRFSGVMDSGIDSPVLAVTVLVSLVTSLAFGLGPALTASRVDLERCLKSSGRRTAAHGGRFGRALVTGEVALAIVLLVAAGLMVRTFLNLTAVEPGFRADRAYALTVWFPGTESTLPSRLEGILASLHAVQGVEAAGAVSYPPLVGFNPGVDVLDREARRRVDVQYVMPDYFRAMEIPLLRGRPLTLTEVRAVPDVALVNQRFAEMLWPDSDALGRHVKVLLDPVSPRSITVVGVVGDVRQFGLGDDPRPEIYLPSALPSMTIVVRTSIETAGLSTALAEAARGAAGNAAISSPKPMTQAVADSLERRRLFAWLLGTLATVALGLAASGIGGVVACRVARRTREIGIRMALGARRRDVGRMVVAENIRRALVGVGLGWCGAWALTRALRGLLYGVGPADPRTFLEGTLAALVVTVVASLAPAYRASRLDPLTALRDE